MKRFAEYLSKYIIPIPPEGRLCTQSEVEYSKSHAINEMLNDLATAVESLQKQVDSMNKTCAHHKPGEVWGGTCSCCNLCPIPKH